MVSKFNNSITTDKGHVKSKLSSRSTRSRKIVSTRNGQLTNSCDVLQSLLKNSKFTLSDHFQRWRLWREWSNIVGSEVSKYCLPVDYRNKTLILWVENSILIQELVFVREPIIYKINHFLKQEWVKIIRFTLDNSAIPPKDEEESLISDLKRITP